MFCYCCGLSKYAKVTINSPVVEKYLLLAVFIHMKEEQRKHSNGLLKGVPSQ